MRTTAYPGKLRPIKHRQNLSFPPTRGSIPVTHRLTADIGMPDLGLEFHNWWFERVLCRDRDVDIIVPTFVRSPWRTWERATQMGDILVITHGVCRNLRAAIRMDISQLFRNPTRSIGSHQPNATVGEKRKKADS